MMTLSRLNLTLIKRGYPNFKIIGNFNNLICKRNCASQTSNKDGESDKHQTISFIQAKANKEWKAAYNFFIPPKEDEVWPSNYYVIHFCLFVAAIYCMFREENDLDAEFDKPLFEKLPHLERPILETALINAYSQGLETKHIRDRLKELQAEGR